MGCQCSKVKSKVKSTIETDPCLIALQEIRQAQQKYFNTHIEVENSDEEVDDIEDSVDGVDGVYGSESSLNYLDDDSMDNVTLDGDEIAHKNRGASPRPSNVGIENGEMVEEESSLMSTEPNGGVSAGTSKSGKSAPNSKKVVKRREKPKYIRLSMRRDFYSIYNNEDKRARTVIPHHYEYPFENLVFEGGGNKGLAYCGCVRLLEEIGVWPQIKRLAGTSAGAMTAALLAVGYDSRDLEQFFSLNLNDIFLDHRFGYLSLLPNLLKSYGWNPGNRIYKWFGQKLQDKTGNADITFRQIYEMFDRELCIVVTNLNQMTSLYCHPKTTPEMPVRLAVRMSMSIPGLFQAVTHTLHGQTDVFVDGGVLCNYPIHCFDGWWLSMKPEDNFLEKLQPLEDIPRLLERTERFGTYNSKTLGFQLYADNEQDLLKYQLENLRHGVQLQELPNTKLAREKIKKKKLQLKTDREHRRLVKAMNSFLRALRRHNLDKNNTIDRDELEAALKDEVYFPKKQRLILFGDVSSDVILRYLDRDQNGQNGEKGGGISYNELVHFMEETGISMQNRFLGYQRRDINNFPKFLDTLQATLLTNVKRVYVEERDLKRTVGINTGHVGTSDFVLEPADVEFVLERGRRSLEAFLKYYVASNNLTKKSEFRKLEGAGRKGSKASLLTVESVDSSSSLKPAVDQNGVSVEFRKGSNLPKTDDKETKPTSPGKSVHYAEKVEFMNASMNSSVTTEAGEDSQRASAVFEETDNLQNGRGDISNFDLEQESSETSALIHATPERAAPSQRPLSLPASVLKANSGKAFPHDQKRSSSHTPASS